ncbi:MAG: phage head morphogenesis protein [Planctomycetes bacterium]|nr:phage head morphogenesis protein [Planctomycetota bacterium]
MRGLEYQLRGEQTRARNAMIQMAASEYLKLGHPPAHVFIAHRVRVRGIITEHYKRTIPVFAAMALSQIKSRRFDRKQAQNTFDSLTQDWISREALRKSTMIADTDRDDVLNALSDGMAEGLGAEEIARNIRKVSELTPFRAATVARTETHAAAAFGSVEGVRQAERDLGVKMLKEWLPTLDDRTRPDHAAMSGYGPIPMDERFEVGGSSMDRPGDPSAPPEQLVNCRCALAYTEATD